MQGGVEVSLHLFLTLALDRGVPAALPPETNPGTHLLRGWLRPRFCLDYLEKNLALSAIRTPDRPARNLVSIPFCLDKPSPYSGDLYS